MKPSYIDMLNAFQEKSIGELGPTEQIVYLRLLMIWNGLCRPVGTFDVSNAQLKHETGIKHHITLKKAKKILVEKGYIKIINSMTHATKFKIMDLTTMSKNDIATMSKNDIATMSENDIVQSTMSKNDIATMSKNDIATMSENDIVQSTMSKNDNQLCQKMTTSQRYRESSSSTTIEPNAQPRSKVVVKYEDAIHPVSSMTESEMLMNDVEQYGEDRVSKAIDRAVLRNKRSLAYIEAILRSWEANGYDEPEVRKGGRKYGGYSGHTEKHEKSIYAKWADGEL